MPFEQAAEEIWFNQQTRVTKETVRNTVYRHGEAAEAISQEKVVRLEKGEELPVWAAKLVETSGHKLSISSDGAFIQLTNGEWREVKSVAIGEFSSQWNDKKGELEVKTSEMSYFSRSYPIREFERFALAELVQRGMDTASLLASVNDGARWIDSFCDYHIPQAIRVLDFSHAANYLAAVGKALFGEATATFHTWFKAMRSQLKRKPPQRTLNDLRFWQRQATTDEQIATIEAACTYLERRAALIDYPLFQAKQLPIGSGSVESGHKVVIHSRMKQAGMRWAEDNVDPLLALRNLICNRRWSQGWQEIVAFYWHQQRNLWRQRVKAQLPPSKPITFASVSVAASPDTPSATESASSIKKSPYRPAPDHPWRRGIWPSRQPALLL